VRHKLTATTEDIPPLHDVYLVSKEYLGRGALAMKSLVISRTYSVVALVAILVSIALIHAPTANAGESGALTIMQQSVVIDYGKKIVISTKVDSGSGSNDVATARALFRPHGGSTIWAYSYPDFSVDGNEVSLSFEIPTGPGSYYPPGTEFDIEIEITLANGEVSSVISPETVEYLDPGEDWQRVEGDGYTVVYYGVSRSEVVSLVETTNSRIPTLKKVLGVDSAPDFKAVVFPSVKAATPSFPPVSQTATDQFLFAGFAQPQYRLFVQGQMNPTTFIHELAHLYTYEAVQSPLTDDLPSWLSEGLARFLETGSSDSSNARLRSSVRPDELLSLRNMLSIPGKRSDVFIFYPQAGAFVGYVVEEYGAESMASFLALMDTGISLFESFEQNYGKPLYDVENDWRENFDAAQMALPTATSSTSISGSESSDATPVPLVEFDPVTKPADQPAPTTAPQSLPTVTPQQSDPFTGETNDIANAPESGPNILVAGIVIGLSIVIGVWLFTSRRRMPKPKQDSPDA
jgi:hypothetical protein